MIQETTFGPKTYLAIKKTVPFSQITDKNIYDQAGQKLGAYIAQNNLQITGPWTVMYFNWDSENEKTDMAIAFPIDSLASVTDDEFSVVTVDESKASKDTMTGSYEGLAEAHGALMKYTQENGLATKDVPVMALEEYVVGMKEDEDPANWKTDIYYFHK